MATRAPELYGIPINEIARLCRVSLKTARRWKSGQSVPPESALMILRRDLGAFHPAWSGWAISLRGELCSPENWTLLPGDVRAVPLMRAQIAAYQLESRQRRGLDEALEEQPLPEQWELATG